MRGLTATGDGASTQSMHVGLSAQSGNFRWRQVLCSAGNLQCGQSLLGRCCRGRRGGFLALGAHRPGRRWRGRSLQLGHDRVRRSSERVGREHAAGIFDNRHRHAGRLPAGHRIIHQEAGHAIGRRHGDGAGRLAAGPDRGAGVGAGRARFKLDLDGRRCRPEIAEGVGRRKGCATGQTYCRCGNRDNTTHDRPVTHSTVRQLPQSRIDHKSLGTATQPGGLIVG
jgi:hypothetical protein